MIIFITKMHKNKQFKSLLRALKKIHYNGYDFQQLTRKEKIALAGRKLSKTKIKERLKKSIIYTFEYPKCSQISDLFCPECGCSNRKYTHNLADHPEVWVICRCIRCNYLISEQDNSPEYYYFDLDFEQYHFIKRRKGFISKEDINCIFDSDKIGKDIVK